MIKILKTISKKILDEEIKEYMQEIQDLKLQIESMINAVNKKRFRTIREAKIGIRAKM